MKAVKLASQIGVAALIFTLTSPVQALGLGNLELQSRLNQRLDANIPVTVPEDIDPSDLDIRLATDAHFERAGIKRGDVVQKLVFVPKRTSDGKMVITVRSRSRMVEPMLSFVLEVGQGEVTTIKHYTVMLRPPE